MKNSVYVIRITLIFISLLMFLGSCTFTSRYVFLNVPDVNDYKKLPSRTVKAGETATFNFDAAKGFDINSIVPLRFNGKTVNNLDTFLEGSGTTAFMVIRNDTVLYENYFNGHDHESYCKAFSASKVFISALIGLAIEEGKIASVNDPVMKYIPELNDKRFAGLTINHCLALTAGIRTNNKQAFPWNDKVRIYYTRDLRKLVSGIDYAKEPGKEFFVEEFSPVILGLVLERATGKSVSDYLADKLWTPLGMEKDGLWVTDRKNNGFEAVNSGLTGVATDFARFGRLYLNQGMWNGKKLLPADWISASTRPDTASISFYNKIEYYEGRDVYYNSMWWGLRNNENEYEYSANGHFGQRIYISPSKNAVVIRFGSKDGKVDWTSFIMKLVEKI
ncbi:MAG: serine hydrolase [Bacteroidales bacterium]